jgi:O-glycosyl hydrolase
MRISEDRITGGTFQEIVAFANPNGSLVIYFENDSDQPVDATFETNGKLYRLHVPAKSMNTFTLSAQVLSHP